MKKPAMRNVHILLADSDSCLAQVVVHVLGEMGFESITHVKSSEEAVNAIRSQTVSLLITEWDMRGSSGIELVRYLRCHPQSPGRTLPIVMLTGRGEMNDVRAARDVGITEFVVKPFSAQTLYMRLEQIIDNPRGFVVANSYVGPERRRRGLPPPGVADRRKLAPVVATHAATLEQIGDTPLLLTPDFSIRRSLGTTQPLSALITPEVLKSAQEAIASLSESSMQWVREDLEEMRRAYEMLKESYHVKAFETLKSVALSIKSRAGTFGYGMASDVARLLYLFLSSDFVPTHPRHVQVIEKHIEALTVIFAQDVKAREGMGQELYAELERLILRAK